MKFHLIRITNPCLLLSCKSINDLVTCPSISSLNNLDESHIISFNCYSNDSYLSTHSSSHLSQLSLIQCESDSDFGE